MPELMLFHANRWEVYFLTRRGKSEAADFIDGLPLAVQKKVVRLLYRVGDSQAGPFALQNEQKFRRLDVDLYELKAHQVRLLCFIEGTKMIVVTHGFLKKSRRTPLHELARAVRLRDRYRQGAKR